MSATVTQIKVSVKRVIATAPYENVTVDLAIEATPDPAEKVLPQIRNLQSALRVEVDAAAKEIKGVG